VLYAWNSPQKRLFEQLLPPLIRSWDTNSGHFRRSGEGATVYGVRIDQTPLAFLGAMQHIGFVAG
jgi:hypothetical protein